MQIPIKSNIPKIISGIVVTISIIALGWFSLPSFWFWVSLEIIAAALVAFGCSGEWWLHHHPAGRKRKEKDEHHKLESKFIGMVSVGVIMELFVLGHSIKEGVKMEAKISGLERTNAQTLLRVEELRKANDELESKLQWRKINDEQIRKFTELLKLTPKAPLLVAYGSSEEEIIRFANRIRFALDSAGFGGADPTNPPYPYGAAYWMGQVVNWSDPQRHTSIALMINDTNNIPAFATELANAFQAIGITNSFVLQHQTNYYPGPSGLAVFVAGRLE